MPLAIIGITAGLLGAGAAFDFMSLLGALALVGLLIKNAIVLIEEIDQQIEEGDPPTRPSSTPASAACARSCSPPPPPSSA